MQYQQVSSQDTREYCSPQHNQNLERYLNEIGKYNVLGNEELMNLAIRYVQFKDPEDARQLILTNLRLVVKIAHKYQAYWRSNFMDLIQEGNAGLVKAIEKFDPYRKVSFCTYATYWIRSYILKYIMDNSRLVKISTNETMRRMYFSYNRKKNQAPVASTFVKLSERTNSHRR